jgi:biopolymer transport protein ExbD
VNNYRIRHEGSPKSADGLTLQQVIEGLLDGRWEPTDEVLGPGEKAWMKIENHPKLTEIANDLKPQPQPECEGETSIDMNALIDVCLVLLVFCCLTTTCTTLQKMIDSPKLTVDAITKPLVLSRDQVEKTIQVKATMENGKPVVRIEGKEVPLDGLVAALRACVKKTHRSTLLLDHDREVPHGTIVTIEDAAQSAGINKVLIVVPKELLK